MLPKCSSKGFSLIELSIGMGVMAILATSIVPIAIRDVQIKAGEKTVLEMAMIQEACRNYYVDNHHWPSEIQQLKDSGYLNSTWEAKNPWNRDYSIVSSNLQIDISSYVIDQVAMLVRNHLPQSHMGEVENGYRSVTSTVPAPGQLAGLETGTIVAWSSNDIPDGYKLCNGESLNIVDYESLYAVIGTRYGSQGAGMFNLPDLRGRTIVGPDNMGGSNAGVINSLPQARVLGGVFGEERHQLSVAEMPRHHHGYMATPWTGSRYDGHSSPLMTQQVQGQTDDTGGDQPHNIVQPSIALNYIIKY